MYDLDLEKLKTAEITYMDKLIDFLEGQSEIHHERKDSLVNLIAAHYALTADMITVPTGMFGHLNIPQFETKWNQLSEDFEASALFANPNSTKTMKLVADIIAKIQASVDISIVLHYANRILDSEIKNMDAEEESIFITKTDLVKKVMSNSANRTIAAYIGYEGKFIHNAVDKDIWSVINYLKKDMVATFLIYDENELDVVQVTAANQLLRLQRLPFLIQDLEPIEE